MARGYMMSAKEARSLVAVQFFGERFPRQEEVDHAMKRTRLLIEYESIYGDKQLLDTDALRSNPVLNTAARQPNLPRAG